MGYRSLMTFARRHAANFMILLLLGLNLWLAWVIVFPRSLYVAVARGDLRRVEVLVRRGAPLNTPADVDPQRQDVAGLPIMTPLQIAAFIGREDIVKVLIEAGADIDLRGGNPEGSSALWIAAREGKVEVVKRLLAAGAKREVSTYSYGAQAIAARQIPAPSEATPREFDEAILRLAEKQADRLKRGEVLHNRS